MSTTDTTPWVRDDLKSGAPEAGGATTRASSFGGGGPVPMILRALARAARAVEAYAYRRLRDLDVASNQRASAPGRPRRARDGASFGGAHPSAM